MILAILIVLWIIKIVNPVIKKPDMREESTVQAEVAISFLWPLLAIAKVFIWNKWARHWIGWGEIETLEQYIVTLFFL